MKPFPSLRRPGTNAPAPRQQTVSVIPGPVCITGAGGFGCDPQRSQCGLAGRLESPRLLLRSKPSLVRLRHSQNSKALEIAGRGIRKRSYHVDSDLKLGDGRFNIDPVHPFG